MITVNAATKYARPSLVWMAAMILALSKTCQLALAFGMESSSLSSAAHKQELKHKHKLRFSQRCNAQQQAQDSITDMDMEEAAVYRSIKEHCDHAEGLSAVQSRRDVLGKAFIPSLAMLISTASSAAPPPAALASSEKLPGSSSPLLSSSSSSSSTSALQESLSGFVAGGALTATKTLVKYPLDTITVRIQVASSNSSATTPAGLWSNPFAGILNPLIWNIPGGAIFFAVKDAVRSFFLQPQQHWGPAAATCISVFCANFPYWLVRNPSEVVKTKQQAAAVLPPKESMNADPSSSSSTGATAWDAFVAEWEENGLAGFYVGYAENLIYAYPADVLKFLLYDSVKTKLSAALSPTDSAALSGALSTAAAQLLTTPLDVVRNRVMTNTTTTKDLGMWDTMVEISREEGFTSLWKGATPRVGKAILSGAIQFATYEETKQQMFRFLTRTT